MPIYQRIADLCAARTDRVHCIVQLLEELRIPHVVDMRTFTEGVLVPLFATG